MSRATIWMRYTGSNKDQMVDDSLSATPRKIFVGDSRPFQVLESMKQWFVDTKEFAQCAVDEKWLRESNKKPPRKNINEYVNYPSDIKRKILFITYNEGGFSGARLWNMQVVNALSEAKCHVHVCTNALPICAQDIPSSVYVTFEYKPDINTDYEGFDCVFVAPPQALSIGLEYSRKYGIPFYALMYESDNWHLEHMPEYENLMSKTTKDVYLEADGIIICSELGKKKCLEWDDKFEDSRIHVVNPSINLDIINSIWTEEKSDEIVFCGRAIEQKGYKQLLEAALKDDLKYDITFIGHDTTRIKNIFKSNENHKINICEDLNDAEKFQIFKRCRLGIVLSRHEGHGIVPAEFLACGKPFVALENDQLRNEYGDDLIYAKSFDKIDVLGAIHKAWDYKVPKEVIEKIKIKYSQSTINSVVNGLVSRMGSVKIRNIKQLVKDFSPKNIDENKKNLVFGIMSSDNEKVQTVIDAFSNEYRASDKDDVKLLVYSSNTNFIYKNSKIQVTNSSDVKSLISAVDILLWTSNDKVWDPLIICSILSQTVPIVPEGYFSRFHFPVYAVNDNKIRIVPLMKAFRGIRENWTAYSNSIKEIRKVLLSEIV